MVEWAQWLALGIVGAASVIFLPMWLIAALQTALEHRRAMRQQARTEEVLQQLQALREELNALRTTSTEHHLSLQAQVDNLHERIRALEAEQQLLQR